MIRDAVEKSEVIIFDCDGVLMDSNGVKEEAFVKITKNHFGDEAAEFIREFHRKNGGVSRRVKFQAVIDKFTPHKSHLLEQLCHQFENLSRNGILNCKLAEDCEKVLSTLSARKKLLMVLSGTPTEVLADVISQRKISQYFERLMGSPKSKIKHLIDLHDEGVLNKNKRFVFIGDSLTDFQASKEFKNCHFFWSEEFASYSPKNIAGASTIDKLKNLVKIRDD